ncbi:helix-turn-helix domain-containing protein [Halovivax gelatinilyticus]|uniref:helix-turn-helix domain-containing protein n=1 Tax=Halovivax gelatinilyticus TaxID=2961597 RepID=UPI0020CA69D8|nr:multiprotein-bridging factor 1 family protein [Halovivax gelatinilyticus]
MAKYSTGSSLGGGGTSCELCGAESDSLTQETVAGAELSVCPSCATHGDGKQSSSGGASHDQDEQRRKKKAAQNVAKANPVWDGDSEHWEREGTNYDDDPLPYLVSEYGSVLESARQDAGLTRAELADDLDVPEADLLAIEQDRATQAGIGGGLIDALEARLDVELAE